MTQSSCGACCRRCSPKTPNWRSSARPSTARDALRKIPDLRPHLLILDVDMPEMNGLETLTVLGREHPRLPVIMFSNLTRRGAQTTLEALALGAKDYVTKPESVGSAGEALEQVRAALVPKIKALCRPWEPAPAVLARRSHEPPGPAGAALRPAPAPVAPVSAAHASAPRCRPRCWRR